jgi:hypothetical protein
MYRLADGTDRTTATRTGDTTLTGARWHSVLISSGNRGLANLNNSAGLPARVIDLPSPITATAEAADQLQDLLPALAGWPLRWALDEHQQLEPLAELLARADQQLAEWRGGRLGRLARHLAACIAGARQLERLIITAPGLGDAAQAAALDHLADTDALLEEQGSMPDRLLAVIFEAAAAHPYAYPSQFEPPGIREVEGYDNNDGRLLVLTGALTKIAAAAGIADPLPALRELRHRGTLESDAGKLATRVRMAGRIVRVYAFRAEDDGPRALPRAPGSDTGAREPSENPRSEGGRAPARPARPSLTEGRDTRAEKERSDALGRRLAALDPETAKRVTDLDSFDAMEAALDALDRLPPPPPPPPVLDSPNTVATGRAQKSERMDVDTRREMLAKVAVHLDPDARHRPERIAAALDRLETAVGLTYEAPSAALAGLQWVHALEARYGASPTLLREEVRLPDQRITATFNLTDPAQADSPGDLLVEYDVNACYLSAGQSLELGTGPLQHIATPDSDHIRKLPGSVIVADPRPDWPAPFYLLEPGERLDNRWAALLLDWLPDARLVNALVQTEHRRWLRLFCRRCLDARAVLRPQEAPGAVLALQVLKAVYSATLGGMLASGPNLGGYNRTAYLRPDWAVAIRAHAGANMWRALHRARPGPAAVVAPDAAYFIGETAGLTVSDQPGKWKLEGRYPLTADIRQALAAGQPGRVRDLAHRG